MILTSKIRFGFVFNRHIVHFEASKLISTSHLVTCF